MGLAYIVPSLLVIINYLVIWHHVKRSASYLRQQGYVKRHFLPNQLISHYIKNRLSYTTLITFIFILDRRMKFDSKIEK